MNLDEYRDKIKSIEDQAYRDKRQAGREYALANNTVAFGDMVEDHIGRVKVEVIKTYHSDPPQCVYEGPEYTKTGKPFKNGSKRTVYQQNLRT